MNWELFVAVRYLIAKRRERFISIISLISIAGVAVGVGVLIIVIAVMSGFDTDLREKIIGTNSHIIIEGEYGVDGISELSRQIQRVKHVTATAPFVYGQAMVMRAQETMGILVRGVDPKQEGRVSKLGSYMKTGNVDLENNGCVIGNELAKRLNLKIGQRITLISPASTIGEEFQVRGIFSSGMYMYDANLIYVGLPQAQGLFGLGSRTSGIAVKIDDALRVLKVKAAVRDALKGYSYSIRSWMDLDKNLITALRLEKIMMFIVVGMIVLVACFNIGSSLIMMVMEKTKDIGILRSIGATAGSIRRIFLLEGLIIGGAGTALGFAFGLTVVRHINPIAHSIESLTGFSFFPPDIYYFSRIPALIGLFDMSCIAGFALAASLVATLYPSHQAARLDPVEALRYE